MHDPNTIVPFDTNVTIHETIHETLPSESNAPEPDTEPRVSTSDSITPSIKEISEDTYVALGNGGLLYITSNMPGSSYWSFEMLFSRLDSTTKKWWLIYVVEDVHPLLSELLLHHINTPYLSSPTESNLCSIIAIATRYLKSTHSAEERNHLDYRCTVRNRLVSHVLYHLFFEWFGQSSYVWIVFLSNTWWLEECIWATTDRGEWHKYVLPVRPIMVAQRSYSIDTTEVRKTISRPKVENNIDDARNKYFVAEWNEERKFEQ